MKKTKLLTCFAALGLVLSLGACDFDADFRVEESESTSTDSEETPEGGEIEEEEPHTHAYVLEYIAPTCTEDGFVTFTCSDCEDTITESIPALGHDYENGAYAYNTENHWKICARCGQKGEESAHTLETTTTDSTCTQAGLTETSCVCGYHTSQAIDPKGHSYTGVVTTAATCTNEGLMTYTCSTCNASYTEVIPATGHTYVQGATVAATCTTDGSTTYTCSACSASYSVVIPKTGHNWQVTSSVTGDCTTAAEVTYTCSYCNATHTDVTPATGHTFCKGVVTVLPTCTDEGEVTFTCSTCGESIALTLDKTDLNHDYSVYVNGCGDTHYTVCSRCGEALEGSKTACTYKLNKYGYDDSGALHKACDVCNGLSTQTVETASPNSDGTYDLVADSSSSLSSALGAVSSASVSDGAQSTIILTEDLDLTDEENSGAYEFSASNVVLDGGEDGVTLEVGNQSTISGSNVTLTNVTLDGSEVTGATRSAAVNVTGKDATFDGCTIIGGESSGSGLTAAGLLVTSTETSSTLTVSDCTITGADRAIYLYNAASDIEVDVTDSYLESIYCFNQTGTSNATLHFENTSLMGWTSYATSGAATFDNCTFGFGDTTGQCYGFLRGYNNTSVFTNCFFRSFTSRQAETENTLINTYGEFLYTGYNNYMFGLGQDNNVVYTLIDCTFERVDKNNNDSISVEDLTADSINLLVSVDFDSDVTSSGFKFSTCENAQLYTYSDLFPTSPSSN